VTRAKISEYSATANDNTDVNGINIAENCPPSSMNNMGREIMAALKRFQTGSDGDGVTVGGSLVVSGSTTANTFSATQITASGTIITAAGTNSAPAIVPTGDTNTGIFFPAADTIAFAEGGAEAMRIDSSGNMGIGTTSPLSDGSGGRALTISNNNTATLYFEDTGYESTGDGLGFFRWNDGALQWLTASRSGGSTTGSTERFRIDSSGNVGIGTSSPSGRLHVSGVSADIWLTDTAGTPNTWRILAKDGTTPALRFYDQTNAAERARITSGGYFKASDAGTYLGSTSAYHEFRNTSASQPGVVFTQTDANLTTEGAVFIRVTRSANSAYRFLSAESNSGNDLEFNLRGDGNAFADGTWSNNGADYAEFFESANGEAIPVGTTVVLDGNKVREATEQDPAFAVIGVVRPKEPSKASMVIGNTAWNKWANKYLTDDFDRYIMEDHDVVEWEEQVIENEATDELEAVVDEDGNTIFPATHAQEATYKTISHSYESHAIPEGITVPEDATVKTHDDKGNKFQHYKLNPAWDKDAEYVNRENRPEWNIIGLVGQVKVLKGQPTNDRWVKMRDVSETVEEWFIR
jgi:hypothetical protein